jgi:hypothetical protein
MGLEGVTGPTLIAAACLAWALDNNCTRRVSQNDPLRPAAIKGFVSGTVNARGWLESFPRDGSCLSHVHSIQANGQAGQLAKRRLDRPRTPTRMAGFQIFPFALATYGVAHLGPVHRDPKGNILNLNCATLPPRIALWTARYGS